MLLHSQEEEEEMSYHRARAGRAVLLLCTVLTLFAWSVFAPSPVGADTSCTTWQDLEDTINAEVSNATVAAALVGMVEDIEDAESIPDCGLYQSGIEDLLDALTSYYVSGMIDEFAQEAVTDCLQGTSNAQTTCIVPVSQTTVLRDYCDFEQSPSECEDCCSKCKCIRVWVSGNYRGCRRGGGSKH